MSEGKKYGLIIPNKAAKSKAVVNPLSVFGNDDDDDDQVVNTNGARFPMKDAKEAQIKRQIQLEMEKAIAVDPTVYEYDNIYDDLQAKKAISDKRLESDVERKPKYIGNLLKAAEQRKRDLERRIEKTVQKEREAEKGLFDDKEAFVTDAYRRKMEEIRQEEERQRKQEELEAQMDVTKQEDMSAFYRNLLCQTSDTVVKTEPELTEIVSPLDEWSSEKCASVAVPGDEDDSNDSSSSSSSSRAHSSRKRCTQVSTRMNAADRRKDADCHRPDSTSDQSSSESDELKRTKTKHGKRPHRKHSTRHRGPDEIAASEEKQHEKYAVDTDSRKHRSDRAHSGRHDHKQADETSSANRRKQNNESNRQDRQKRKHAESVDESTSHGHSKTAAHSDDSRQKQARTEPNQTGLPSRTPKQTVGTALDDARARYLARKGKLSTPVVCEDSE